MHSKLSSGHFYGTSLTTCELAGIRLLESTYPPRQKHPSHSHEHASFCLVLQGDFTHLHRQKTLTCRPSTLLFYPPDEAHADHFYSRGARCFIIELKPHWTDRLREHSVPIDNPAHFHGGKLANLAMRLYKESRVMDEVSSLSIEGLALEMMAEASRRAKQLVDRLPTHPVEQAREMLHAHFSERLTLAVIAKTVGLHPAYLACQFRKLHGCTIGEYVRQLRIEFACRELSSSDESLAGIASAAGFFDQSHFTRTFKRLTGLTPAEYRSISRSN